MKVKHEIHVTLLVAAFVLGLAGSAFAVDGITLIKQTATTVFPITISASGSYRLASDLTVTSTSVDAIDINANNVTLDLNGFSIIGPGSGGGIGINTTANTVTVTNGVVTAMGFEGVELGDHADIEGVRALSNGSDGIVAGSFSRVIGNVSNNSNSGVGIDCLSDCLVSGNTANANGDDGMLVGDRSAVIGNSASGNVSFGLAFPPNDDGGYGKNVMENNGAGCVDFFDGSAISMGDNICNGVKQ